MHPLKDKNVTHISCGGNFAIALGQTLRNQGEIGGKITGVTEGSFEGLNKNRSSDLDRFNSTVSLFLTNNNSMTAKKGLNM